jgi:poly(A) polymerase
MTGQVLLEALQRLATAAVFEAPALESADTAWSSHIPFAFWLVDALRPRTFVELGVHTGVSYCAFCQAIASAGLVAAAYGVDTWEGDAQAGRYDGPAVLAALRAHHDTRYLGFSHLLQMTFDAARERFAEDHLRMLRAVRFAAVLGFEIEPKTLQAIRANAATITDIAWERIGDEIVRMLTEGGRGAARRAFELLDATDLLLHVLPEVAAMKGVEQSPDYHPEGDVWTHTLLVIEQLDHATQTLALGALLHDVAKPLTQARHDHRITFYGHCERGADMAVAICQRLRRSRETWERVAFLVREHLRHIHAREMRPSTLKRFLAQEGIEELLELVRMDILASNGNLDTYEFCRAKLAELRSQGNLPPPLLKGRDLLAAGYAPGPQIGEILRSVRDLQLDGQLHTREEALAWVSEHYPPATS